MRPIFNYDILMNPDYQKRFVYVPVGINGRLKQIGSLDYEEFDEFKHVKDGKKFLKPTEQQSNLYNHSEKKLNKETGEEEEVTNHTTNMMARCQSDYVRVIVEMAYLKDASDRYC